eukprot:jgi/Hompol1/4519/HPOL_003690-RA
MLEAQLKELQEQLEEKDAVIEKYRERWDKLKESAKKKKEAKSLAGEPLNSNDTAPAAATTAGNLLSDRLAQARSLDLPPLPHEAAAPSLSSTITNRLDATSSRPPLAAAMSSSIAPSLYHSTLSRYDDIFDNDDNSL